MKNTPPSAKQEITAESILEMVRIYFDERSLSCTANETGRRYSLGDERAR